MNDYLKLDYFFGKNSIGELSRIDGKVSHPWQLVTAKDQYLSFSKSKIASKISKNISISGPVLIGKNVVIEPFVVIDGPVVIGNDSHIRSFTKIRPKTIIGSEVEIGHAVELKNSIIFDLAKIQSFSFVGDSVIGLGTRIASGVICANRRFDQKIIEIKVEGEKISTGTDKFGTIVGDYSRVGAHCTIAPGTLIGKHVWIYPNLFVKGFIPSDSFVKVENNFRIETKKRVVLSRYDQEGKP